ncbi:putative glycoside hydrolase [Bacillus suaedaesalsae]|uniref:Glycoside hydrolase n=1 Tax=Bacillus suaedaesalsae TaxID=2810349 RepID=A0ABS2DIG0_9BACI|nr:putative glycoside hydrolase [Bacillus suaedaesalsae]MBM6618277.1 putative glycoside hydrolase [Bacillus suaedaesalsae]
MNVNTLKIAILTIASTMLLSTTIRANESIEINDHKVRKISLVNKTLPANMTRFVFDSGFTFQYPEAVRGIYVSAGSFKDGKINSLLQLVNSSDLNAMVIDIKDDVGNITYTPNESSPYTSISKPYIQNVEYNMKIFEKHQIYPIARIVVFKDTILAKSKPDLSFIENDHVWSNGIGDSFVNPFLKEVWDYNVQIAIDAAKLGFQEIQFDYVRFPEGFERMDRKLSYSMGVYKDKGLDPVQARVQAVSDFVQYAREQLKPYNVKVSVDIFGYAATIPEAPGIGQNFSKISENVDVISSMIYPSHWTSYFGIHKPDLEPYRLVSEYSKVESARLKKLNSPPISRPWLQDFTAVYLGKGNYKSYGKEEVEAQIRALNEQGISEFLLWNAGNSYTRNVDYTPLK